MTVWIAVVLFIIQAPDGSAGYIESRPPVTFESSKECVSIAGAAAAATISESDSDRIIGYTVICAREEEV